MHELSQVDINAYVVGRGGYVCYVKKTYIPFDNKSYAPKVTTHYLSNDRGVTSRLCLH